MRQLYAAISSSFIHLVCAFMIYSLWYSVQDIPPAQAAELRVLDIGMLQGQVLSQQQQSARSEASQALASLDAQASHGEKEAAEPVMDSLSKTESVVEPIAETKPESVVETIAETKTEPVPPSADVPVPELEPIPKKEIASKKIAESASHQPAKAKAVTAAQSSVKPVTKHAAKPVTQVKTKPAVRPVTKPPTKPAKSAAKPVTKHAVKQAPSQARVGSGLAQRNQLKQEGVAAQSLGGQGQAQGREQGTTYLAGLLHTISQRAARSYPQQARQMRHEGRARVAFKILDDGRFSDIRLLHSSGHHSLDQAALGTVQHLGQYAAPPVGVNRHVSTTIVFSLKR